MTSTRFWLGAGMVTVLVLAVWSVSSAGQDSAPLPGIPPDVVADYLHAVIEADRTFYTLQVVERLQKKGVLVASENWRAAHTLPLPAQFLMESGELAAKTGTKIRYRLISLSPINPQNGPSSDFERKALDEVRVQPERSSTGTVMIDERNYFQAVYADRAVSQACIGCHNAHPRSPKRDFQMNDVLGAVVITIPLGQTPN